MWSFMFAVGLCCWRCAACSCCAAAGVVVWRVVVTWQGDLPELLLLDSGLCKGIRCSGSWCMLGQQLCSSILLCNVNWTSSLMHTAAAHREFTSSGQVMLHATAAIPTGNLFLTCVFVLSNLPVVSVCCALPQTLS